MSGHEWRYGLDVIDGPWRFQLMSLIWSYSNAPRIDGWIRQK